MSWRGERNRHSLSARGIKNKQVEVKRHMSTERVPYIDFYRSVLAYWRKKYPISSLPRDSLIDQWYDEYLETGESHFLRYN